MVTSRINYGAGFRGAISYGSRSADLPPLTSHLGPEVDYADMIAEFRAMRQARPDISRPVTHVVLSWAPEDGAVSDAAMMEAARRMAHDLGYGNGPWVAYRHDDGEAGLPHLHLFCSQITHDSTRVERHQDMPRARRICEAIEVEHGWRRTGPQAPAITPSIPIPKPKISTPAPATLSPDGPVMPWLSERLQEALAPAKTVVEMATNLQKNGITMVPIMKDDGSLKGLGLRYGDSGFAWISDVNKKSFTLANLQKKHGLEYREDRDLPILQRLSAPSRSQSLTATLVAAEQVARGRVRRMLSELLHVEKETKTPKRPPMLESLGEARMKHDRQYLMPEIPPIRPEIPQAKISPTVAHPGLQISPPRYRR